MSGTKALTHDIGAFVDPRANPVPASGAGAVNGAAIDRQDFHSCVLLATTGAASGGPTTQTLDAKIQDSADGSTGWADVTGAATTQLTADNTETSIDFDLHATRRYIRVVQTIAFTGGASPAWPCATVLVLGGDRILPT